MQTAKRTHLYNLLFCLMDGGLWGFGLGFTSLVAILPLFFGTLTRSAILIGLVPALFNLGVQLPQMFAIRGLSQMPLYKSLSVWRGFLQRVPVLGFMILSFVSDALPPGVVLVTAFFLVALFGLFIGLNTPVWLAFIRKIFSGNIMGSILGAQAALVNLMSAGSAVLAGLILSAYPTMSGFGYCFLLAYLSMLISLLLFKQLKETPRSIPLEEGLSEPSIWDSLIWILRKDKNFRLFLLVKGLIPFGLLSFSFYSVYAVWERGLDAAAAGGMAALLMLSQVAANPILGVLGDRWSHRNVLAIGMLTAGASSLAILWLPGLAGIWIAFILAGISLVSSWTTVTAMTMQFGTDNNRPVYIGISNTITAPAVVLAPVLGGILADGWGYPVTFWFGIVGAMLTAGVLAMMREPRSDMV